MKQSFSLLVISRLALCNSSITPSAVPPINRKTLKLPTKISSLISNGIRIIEEKSSSS